MLCVFWQKALVVCKKKKKIKDFLLSTSFHITPNDSRQQAHLVYKSWLSGKTIRMPVRPRKKKKRFRSTYIQLCSWMCLDGLGLLWVKDCLLEFGINYTGKFPSKWKDMLYLLGQLFSLLVEHTLLHFPKQDLNRPNHIFWIKYLMYYDNILHSPQRAALTEN